MSDATFTWTDEKVRAAVAADPTIFNAWSEGRPPGWSCDQRTKDIVCLGYWLRAELGKFLNEDDRKAQEFSFERLGRSRNDLHALAAEVMNDALAGKIFQRPKNSERMHRGW